MTTTKTPEELAAKLAKWLNRTHEYPVWPRMDSQERLYFVVGHELDVHMVNGDWALADHELSRCPGCVPCDICGSVQRGQEGARAQMTHVTWQGTELELCGECARADGESGTATIRGLAEAARRKAVSLAQLDDPWAPARQGHTGRVATCPVCRNTDRPYTECTPF